MFTPDLRVVPAFGHRGDLQRPSEPRASQIMDGVRSVKGGACAGRIRRGERAGERRAVGRALTASLALQSFA
jgi:hypothetical protein